MSMSNYILKRIAALLRDDGKKSRLKAKLLKDPKMKSEFSKLNKALSDIQALADKRSAEDPVYAAFKDALDKMLS